VFNLSEVKYVTTHDESTKPTFAWTVLAIVISIVLLGLQVAEGYVIDPGTPALVVFIMLVVLITWILGKTKRATYEWSPAAWK